ncbi:hypothetical protein E4K72_09080 [Oxalobacteraceae bacterium OM1]|nr:hypothetical protein E4K72_09080 [Oxalobacteraceae bacterium OM1]
MKRLFALVAIVAAPAFAQIPDEVLNHDVTQHTIMQTICVSGYTKEVRPATSYTNGVKRLLMKRQGIDWSRAGELELDHKIPLALGGHPRNPHNLMLQPWGGKDGARVKDKLEVRLKRMVCNGSMPLAMAQACIWDDWRKCEARTRR